MDFLRQMFQFLVDSAYTVINLSPETVNQLGMRRDRQSLNPARVAKSTGKIHTPCLRMPMGSAVAGRAISALSVT